MTQAVSSIKEILYGKTPFYEDPNYAEVTDRELSTKHCPKQSAFVLETRSKTKRVAEVLFTLLSIIIFPILIYRAIRVLIGFVVVPSKLMKEAQAEANDHRKTMRTTLEKVNRVVKRIQVKADETEVDAYIVGTKKSLKESKRWILYSPGNGEIIESSIVHNHLHRLAEKLNANLLFYNYPGVQGSRGWTTKKTLTKAHTAMMTLLESVGEETITFGNSLGGGVLGQSMESYKPKKKVVIVQRQTFGNLPDTGSAVAFRLAGPLMRFFGWNLTSERSARDSSVPKIVLQSVKEARESLVPLKKTEIVYDGVIPAEVSLAKVLLEKKITKNITFLGISENHGRPLYNGTIDALSEKIMEKLKTA